MFILRYFGMFFNIDKFKHGNMHIFALLNSTEHLENGKATFSCVIIVKILRMDTKTFNMWIICGTRKVATCHG